MPPEKFGSRPRKKAMSKQYESELNIKLLDASLQKLASNFKCGNIHIDNFLKSNQALDDGFGKTYVWLEDDNAGIIGYYNISVGCVDSLEGEAHVKMGGAIHINEFALDTKYRGVSAAPGTDINLSDLLLKDCINRVLFLRSEFVGFSFITLQSTKEGYGLYSRNEFEDIEDDMSVSKLPDSEKSCWSMYLALDLE